MSTLLESVKSAPLLSELQARFNKFIVQAYKLAGFIALTTILFGLLSYFSVHAFYFVSRSWATPIIVSPSDKQVLELRAQLAQQTSLRDSLAAQRFDLDAKVEDADRLVAEEEDFQREYQKTLIADIAFRKKALVKMSRLSASHAYAANRIARANQDYANLTREQAKELFAARLITKEDAARASQQTADLAGANLGLDVKGVELDTNVSALGRDIESLSVADATLRASQGGPRPDGAMSQEVLTMKHEFDRSKLEAARARSTRKSLEKTRAGLDAAITRYDGLLKSIKDSPYLRAVDKHVTIAFVPYDNIGSVRPGAKIYACRANFVFCRNIGRVADVLEGEVTGKHPTQSIEVRGVLVEMELDDLREAESPVLHFGSAPLFI
jgi:hypothetical protein